MGKAEKPYGNIEEAKRRILNYAKNNPHFTEEGLQKIIEKNPDFRGCLHFLDLKNLINSMSSFSNSLFENGGMYSITQNGIEELGYLEQRYKESTSQ